MQNSKQAFIILLILFALTPKSRAERPSLRDALIKESGVEVDEKGSIKDKPKDAEKVLRTMERNWLKIVVKFDGLVAKHRDKFFLDNEFVSTKKNTRLRKKN